MTQKHKHKHSIWVEVGGQDFRKREIPPEICQWEAHLCREFGSNSQSNGS